MVILDNLLPPNTNLLMLEYLATTPWYLSGDNDHGNKLQIALENNSGFQNITFQDGEQLKFGTKNKEDNENSE